MGCSGQELFKKYPDLNGLNKFIKESFSERVEGLDDMLAWQKLLGDDDSMDWQATSSTTGNAGTTSARRTYDDDDDEPRAYGNDENDDHLYDNNEIVVPKFKTLLPNFTKVNILIYITLASKNSWKFRCTVFFIYISTSKYI